MYLDFFNLTTLPFENTPDPRFFYASEQHREALAAIEYTIRMRKGFVLVTGDIGSGKTTIGRTMCERLGDQASIVPVLHGHADGDELLRQVLRSLNVKAGSRDDHGRLLERLRQHLLTQLDINRPVVLFIDEAQTLADAALEELRLLSNLDTAVSKPVQIVLVGQPELRQRLRSRRFDALRQRIVMAKQLRPLSVQETAGYIGHRLRAASVDATKVGVNFADAAVQAIFTATHGIPRLINVGCDNCLLLAFVRESREVTPAMVQRVMQDMVPSFADAETAPALSSNPAPNNAPTNEPATLRMAG